MSKLTWEWDGTRDDLIRIHKPKGKLTVNEIMDFMQTRDMMNTFGEGALVVIAWRTKSDWYQGFNFEEDPGDTKDVYVLTDESRCFCGQVLHMQYCPECGHKLMGGDEQ